VKFNILPCAYFENAICHKIVQHSTNCYLVCSRSFFVVMYVFIDWQNIIPHFYFCTSHTEYYDIKLMLVEYRYFGVKNIMICENWIYLCYYTGCAPSIKYKTSVWCLFNINAVHDQHMLCPCNPRDNKLVLLRVSRTYKELK